MLRRLLVKMQTQQTDDKFSFQIVVADNDSKRSAETTVLEFSRHSSARIIYCCEPEQNIALVRNRALSQAGGEFVAFIDDDEFPAEDWLLRLLQACDQYSVSGVLGPVRPHFDSPPPNWVIKGRFCERPEPPTGTIMEWSKCRTGNVLFQRQILKDLPAPFRKQFGTGGEDKDFFMQMTERGCTFVWCNEAVVYESVPPNRWTRRYMISRALLRGRNVLKHPKGRIKLVAQSCVAVPAYFLILPLTLLCGQHVFMKYGIKFFDHLGRLLTVLSINPVHERQM